MNKKHSIRTANPASYYAYMNNYPKRIPITKTYIDELRAITRKHLSREFEENLSDRAIVELSELMMLQAYLQKVFKDGEYLMADDIEY